MPKYDRKSVSYVTVEFPLIISFPENNVVCDLCPLCHAENYGTRYRCSQTGEILPYHNVDYGLRCPLPLPNKTIEIEGEDEE